MRPPYTHSLRQNGKLKEHQEKDLHPTAKEDRSMPGSVTLYLRKNPGIRDTETALERKSQAEA